jgi:hypothetical protein
MKPTTFNEPQPERLCFDIRIEVTWDGNGAVINGKRMTLEAALNYLATLPIGASL